jgi:hypothetical protein
MVRTLGRVAPAGAVVGLAAAALLRYDTEWSAVLRFAVLLGVGISLPGTLCWRALRGNVDGFVADVAFGTGLGMALSMLTYLLTRAAGVPLLVLAFPLITIVLFGAVPGLRQHWRSAGPQVPRWWGWAVAAACVVAVAVIVRVGLALEPATFPGVAFGYVDMPYHLALAGELKHHVPPSVPYVAGEPLRYHWFFHAQLASMNWQSGIELDLLLRRLMPMLVAVLPVVGAAALATRLSSRNQAGPVAAWLLVGVSSLDVYGWNGAGGVAVANQFSTGVLIHSPTHAYGVPMLFFTVWVAACVLRACASRGDWVLLLVGLVALVGAKATFIPMLVAGAGLAFVVRSLVTRRPDRDAAVLLAAAALVGVVGYAALYSGGAGNKLDFTGTVRLYGPQLGFGRVDVADRPSVVSSTITYAVSWGLCAAGMLGFARRRTWRDPAAALMVGFVLAGLLASFAYSQWSGGQMYFARAVFPVAIVASAWGLTLLFDGARRALPLAAASFAVGLAAAWLTVQLTRQRPDPKGRSTVVAWQSSWPWLLVIGIAGVVGVILYVTLRRSLVGWWTAVGLVVVTLFGASSLAVPATLARPLSSRHCADGPDRPTCSRRQVPEGGELVARYVRAHSRPGDVIATNMHCVPADRHACDTRSFWLAGYAERRVLLEGWAYTDQANAWADAGENPVFHAFWDPAMQAANDIVFSTPTQANLVQLRDRHGVRWLVHDRSVAPVPPELEALALGRFEAGSLTVYALQP